MYLSEDELARLAAVAEREGVSRAEILRRAIRSYEPARQADRNFVLVACADGPGGSIADLDEKELLEGFGS